MPEDTYGEKHIMGVFDHDAHYEDFITQGAKKYAYTKWVNKSKIKDTKGINIQDETEDKYKVLEITVSGVPKTGAIELHSIDDFKDDLVFHFNNTNKNMLFYCDDQSEEIITDYQGHTSKVIDKSGCCLVPTTYILGKSQDYAYLISDDSARRSIYGGRKEIEL